MFTVIYTKGESAPKISSFADRSQADEYIDELLYEHSEWYKTRHKKSVEWVWDKREWVYYFPDSSSGYYEHPGDYACIELSW